MCGASCKAEAPCRTVLLSVSPPRVVRVRVRSLASQNAARRLRRPAAPLYSLMLSSGALCVPARCVRALRRPRLDLRSQSVVNSPSSLAPLPLCACLVFRGAQVLRLPRCLVRRRLVALASWFMAGTAFNCAYSVYSYGTLLRTGYFVRPLVTFVVSDVYINTSRFTPLDRLASYARRSLGALPLAPRP